MIEGRSRWLLVKRDFDSAAKHFAMARRLHDERLPDLDIGDYVVGNAFMHAVQSGHTSLESGLLKIFKIIGEASPKESADNWHEAAVFQACEAVDGRPPIIPADLQGAVDETRRARNVSVRGYDGFDLSRTGATAEAAECLAKALPGVLEGFVQAIDPPGSARKVDADLSARRPPT